MLAVDVLQTETELADEFVAAVESRYLPEKFFYWFPLSVKAWLDLCRGQQPYKNYSRSRELVQRVAKTLPAAWPGDPPSEVISLGAGQGDKDMLILQSLTNGKGRQPLLYRPVDSSLPLLELAVQHALQQGVASRGLKADVASDVTAAFLSEGTRKSPPQLWLILGNSLGIIRPEKFLGVLSSLMRAEDRLLVDGEIYDRESTLAGYENPVNRRFAFAPLASIGLEEGRDGALVFEQQADTRIPGLQMVTKYFQAARRLELRLAGRQMALEAREKIEMNCSYKYSLKCFLGLLRNTGKFQILREELSADGRFAMVLAAPEKAAR